MATADDLWISIQADIGALQSQLRGIDVQFAGRIKSSRDR